MKLLLLANVILTVVAIVLGVLSYGAQGTFVAGRAFASALVLLMLIALNSLVIAVGVFEVDDAEYEEDES